MKKIDQFIDEEIIKGQFNQNEFLILKANQNTIQEVLSIFLKRIVPIFFETMIIENRE